MNNTYIRGKTLHGIRGLMAVAILLSIVMAEIGMAWAQAEAPKFRKTRIRIGKAIVTVEVAETEIQQEYGLMFRDQLAEGTGMIFPYPEARNLTFWMKNTRIPLSLGFFDADQKLVGVKEMVPDPPGTPDAERERYESGQPVMFAVEMPKKWFERKRIKLGDRMEFLPDKKAKKVDDSTAKNSKK